MFVAEKKEFFCRKRGCKVSKKPFQTPQGRAAHERNTHKTRAPKERVQKELSVPVKFCPFCGNPAAKAVIV